MKHSMPKKKLSIKKITVANLNFNEQKAVKAGYLPTNFWGGCYTWYPVCYTKPDYTCRSLHTICETQPCGTLGECEGPTIMEPMPG